jgi:hypothetical protein
MSWRPRAAREESAFAPRGLVAMTAATMRARFGVWPADFLDLCKRLYRGQVPRHIEALASELARSRPWERCAHGVDLTSEHPYCGACIHGDSTRRAKA